MDPHPTFLKSIEIHSRKSNQDPKNLIHSMHLILQEKRDLEETYNKIVKQSIIPHSKPSNLSKPLSRSKEFIRKKIHYINCPAIIKQSSQNITQESKRMLSESERFTEEDFTDLSFLSYKIPEPSHTIQTSIFYAEDLFGNKKVNTEKFELNKRPKRKIISNFNNSYTRHIAGSSATRGKRKSDEIIHDPLIAFESILPSHMRTLTKDSPWVYSSVLRTNIIHKVKSKNRGN